MSHNKIKRFDLVIFGAKGDLTKRKLIPAFYQLEKFKKFHKKTKIIGVGRATWNKKKFLKIVKKSLKNFMNDKINYKIWKKLKSRIYFCKLDINKTSNFLKLKKILQSKSKKNIINYFATPPDTYANICKGLASINFNTSNCKIIVEKPIGSSYKTSKKIHKKINIFFKEKQIFRIDHYLGKETIINLFFLKFLNPIFFNNWSNKTIDHIQITLSEELGVENRWNYFNSIGQTRDMVQNHLLQIISILAMETPINLNFKNIQNEKLKVLKSLRIINKKNINIKTVRGQYSNSNIHGIKIPAYTEESKICNKSLTETFVAIKINIDNHKWFGIPFYVRTGKKLKKKKSEIVIVFKSIKFNIFKNNKKNIPKNRLHIRIQPNEGLRLFILNKKPSLNKNIKYKEIKLSNSYHKIFKKKYIHDAYEKLIFEVIRNKQSLFVSKKEVEQSWKWIDSLMNAWKLKKSKVELYQPGSWGPKSSENLLKKNGYNWY
ncbi:glucose-6-phosphate dehydrogenase [Buchnera aphidicola]|uniref:glucose-6-phosphate dehydrogenase n=1 Tax=Buchnera aphidicola TaxID=9 RepID=UPI0030EDED89